jgi:hypothetical protein
MNAVIRVSSTVHRGLRLTPASELAGAHTPGWLRPWGFYEVTSTRRGSSREPHQGFTGRLDGGVRPAVEEQNGDGEASTV